MSERLVATVPLLSPEECSSFLAAAEELSGWRIAGGSAGTTRVLNVPHDHEISEVLAFRLSESLESAYDVPLSGVIFDEAAIVRYCVGATVPSHTDINPSKRHRVLSFITYLTDGFAGGELCIPSLSHNCTAPLGQAIVFPSSEIHFARPVLSGDKSIIVGFISQSNEGFNGSEI